VLIKTRIDFEQSIETLDEPASSTMARASSPTTSAEANRRHELDCELREPSFSAPCTSVLAACKAGASAKTTPVMMAGADIPG
jgi:hypothetical protein